MRRIPSTAASISERKKSIPQFTVHDFHSYTPCWRIGHFDFDGKWGLSSLLGNFTFNPDDKLEMFALEYDGTLAKCIDVLRGRQFPTVQVFWKQFAQEYGDNIPLDTVKMVGGCISRTFFFEKIYPKLQTFENTTWETIDRQTHDNGKSSNHNESVAKLSKEAQDRLAELSFSDRSEIFSLRLENKLRIFGFREMNFLDIIWVDTGHEVYPSKKNHT